MFFFFFPEANGITGGFHQVGRLSLSNLQQIQRHGLGFDASGTALGRRAALALRAAAAGPGAGAGIQPRLPGLRDTARHRRLDVLEGKLTS